MSESNLLKVPRNYMLFLALSLLLADIEQNYAVVKGKSPK